MSVIRGLKIECKNDFDMVPRNGKLPITRMMWLFPGVSKMPASRPMFGCVCGTVHKSIVEVGKRH